MGRRAGITEDEYQSLIKLDKKDFEYREWIALGYAREWTFAKGGSAAGEIGAEFRRLYTVREQALILKLMRAMLFANWCGNGYYKRPWRRGDAYAQACPLPLSQPGSGSDL